VPRAEVPERDSDGHEDRGDDGDERQVFGRDRAAEQTNAGVKRCEAERDDPAEEKLHHATVDRKRVAAKGDYVPDGRMDADAVFPEERDGAEDQEYRDVDDSGAEAEEEERQEFSDGPVDTEALGSPPHAERARGYFLKRLDAEGLKQDLEERRDWTEKDAVEFPFNDVVVAKVVEVEADDVEQAVGDLREAPQKNYFFEAPAGKLRGFLKKDDHEAERENRGGHAGGEADEKIAAVTDADFGVLREIIGEEKNVSFRRGNNSGEACFFLRDGSRSHSSGHRASSLHGW
jgi:hypothetical protein